MRHGKTCLGLEKKTEVDRLALYPTSTRTNERERQKMHILLQQIV